MVFIREAPLAEEEEEVEVVLKWGPIDPGTNQAWGSMVRAEDQATPEGFMSAQSGSPPVADAEGFAVVPGSILLLAREVD